MKQKISLEIKAIFNGGLRPYLSCFLLSVLLTHTGSLWAESEGRILSIEELFSAEWEAKDFDIVGWGPHDGEYMIWRPASDGRLGMDLVAVSCSAGTERIVVPAQRFVPNLLDPPLRPEQIAWNRQKSRLLIFTESQRVWRYNTRGDYWVLDLTSGHLHKLGGVDARPSSLMFAEFSPDGRLVAYVRENNLYVEDPTSGQIRPITSDCSKTIINGTADWVYEEELSLRKAYEWSPDSRYIAFWRFDTSEVGLYHMLDQLSDLYPKVISLRYPKSGTKNSAVTIHIADLCSGKVRQAQLPGDPREHYPARVLWDPKGRFFYVQQLNRRQNTNRIYRVDPSTGAVSLVAEDRDSAWVEMFEQWRWLDDEGRRLLWRSERSGWAALYSIDVCSGQWRQLTRNGMDVIDVVGFEPGRFIYFIASPKNPAQRYLYRIALDGGGEQLVTPGDQPGTHTYDISPDGRWAIHRWSAFDRPPCIDLIELPSHRSVRILEDNGELRKRLSELAPLETGFFRVEVEPGLEIDGWYIRPAKRKPHSLYPVLVYVYGEPAAQTVLDKWGGWTGMWHRMMAQRGYVVLSFDNRGTPAPRGRAWRKAIYGKMGVIGPRDQALALEKAFQRWPWLDRQRIGIWGWSGGGSMTLHALFQFPDLYKVGVSIAPVPNMRLYDTIYQERYMGLPDENPEGYMQGSPIYHAKNLKGKLLLVHGTGDDNVHYQGMEVLINELVSWNKRFFLLVYPNRRHGISEGMNVRRHLYTSITEFLIEQLPPGPIDIQR